MAINPQQILPSFVRVYDTNIANFKIFDSDFTNINYKMIFKLYDNTTYKSTTKITTDSSGIVYYNPTEYISSLVTYNTPTDVLQDCTSSYANITIKIWREYGDPVTQYTGTTSYTNFYWNGVANYKSYGEFEYIIKSGTTGKYLSPVTEFNCDTTDKLWLYFINYTGTTAIRFIFYNNTTVLSTQNTTLSTVGSKMYSFPCGPANMLIGITAPTGYTHYTIQSIIGGLPDPTIYSELVTITYKPKCNKYEKIQAVWLNEHGGYSTYTFNKKKFINIKYNRLTYDKYLTPNYTTPTVRGLSNYKNEILETVTLNSDFLDDNETTLIESMLSSVDVRLIETVNGTDYLVPYIIVNTDFNKKNNTDDKLYSVSIDVQATVQKSTQIL